MTTIFGDVGQAFTAEVFKNNNFYVNAPEPAATRDLPDGEVRTYRTGFVRPEGWANALEVLGSHGVVILVGAEGTGRRTAAVNLLAELGFGTIRELLLDEGQADRLPPPGHGCGYLLDLAGVDVGARVGARLRTYAATLRDSASVLVVLATDAAWEALDWEEDHAVAVTLPAPAAVEILRHRLAHRWSLDPGPWCREPRIAQALVNAAPKDAVRLAAIIAEARKRRMGASTTTADAVSPSAVAADSAPSDARVLVDDTSIDEVLGAYSNWAKHLKAWFGDRTNEEGMARAVLLATAVLEGCSVTSTLLAADLLVRRLELPSPPGKGLLGPGGAHLIEQAGGTIDGGGVHFSRLRFARSVLDFVWQDRPVLQGELVQWLVELPLQLPDEVRTPVAEAVAGLAVRRRRADLVFTAARRWWDKPACHQSAVEAVTRAATDERVGRWTRRRLYQIATSSSESDLHALVVQVCAGPLGQRFPQIAMTRLKHVAARTAEPRADVVDAVVSLAQHADPAAGLLGRVVEWSMSESQALRRTGTRVFLELVRMPGEQLRPGVTPRDPGRETTDQTAQGTPHSRSQGRGQDDRHGVGLIALQDLDRNEAHLLVLGWRAALQETWNTLRDGVAAGWLEAALQGAGDRELVVEILASACLTMRDLGGLTWAVDHWRFESEDPAAPDRRALADELLGRAHMSVVEQLEVPLPEPDERITSS